MLKRGFIWYVLMVTLVSACTMNESLNAEPELVREPYTSHLDQSDREFFVYLPKGYHSQPEQQWPVMLFLHGNGERGNGKDELGFVLKNGPLYEAWVQKKDLPFIIISPQLHMFDFDQRGLSYIDDRQKSEIPQRLASGVAERPAPFSSTQVIERKYSISDMSAVDPLLPLGWEQVEHDLLAILEQVTKKYRVDRNKTYLSGLSYGGFGTWFLASKHPEKFAAIAPVVGWGHPSLMAPIARHNIPVWQFAGGRDSAVNIQYFYAGIEALRALGHERLRFTVHEEMPHDAWTRVYASDDFYHWLLSHSLD